MGAQKMPGFTAEECLHKTAIQYGSKTYYSLDNYKAPKVVVPQYSRLCLALVRACYYDDIEWACERVGRYC
jgi:hypothetical protein